MSMRAGDNLPHPLEAAGCKLLRDAAAPPSPSVLLSPSLGGGRTAQGLEVEWLAEQQQHPMTTLFLASLSEKFGKRIANTVQQELGLDARVETVHANTADQAIHMAKTQMDVFAGANFFVELHCSATSRGAGYIAACQRIGIAPTRLDANDIDRRFCAALAQASQRNQLPLSPHDGERILENLLRQDAENGSVDCGGAA